MLLEGDTSGVICLVFLNQEKFGSIREVIYVIKYDKLKMKIVGIKKENKIGFN